MKRTFRCYICNTPFPLSVTEDKEAQEEFHKKYPECLIEDAVLVCDSCEVKVSEFIESVRRIQ